MIENREEAFNAMVMRQQDLIWHVCSDYSLSAAYEVEDGVQEVLCALWRYFDKFEGRSSERTWVYKVATNAMLMLYRKAGNRTTGAERTATVTFSQLGLTVRSYACCCPQSCHGQFHRQCVGVHRPAVFAGYQRALDTQLDQPRRGVRCRRQELDGWYLFRCCHHCNRHQ